MLEDPEDNKFGGTNRRDANLADQSSIQDIVLRHHRTVAGDEKCALFGLSAKSA